MFEKFSEMKKTSGKRPKIKSEVLSTEEITQGSETKVLQAELKYKEGKIVEGFVYKNAFDDGKIVIGAVCANIPR